MATQNSALEEYGVMKAFYEKDVNFDPLTSRRYLASRHLSYLKKVHFGDLKHPLRPGDYSDKDPTAWNAYLPSMTSFERDGTRELTIKRLVEPNAEHIFKDRFLICRTITRSAYNDGFMTTLVDDPDGDAMRLLVSNCSEDLPSETYIVVQHPYFRWGHMMLTGMIRVENPRDHIRRLSPDDPLLRDIEWKGRVVMDFLYDFVTTVPNPEKRPPPRPQLYRPKPIEGVRYTAKKLGPKVCPGPPKPSTSAVRNSNNDIGDKARKMTAAVESKEASTKAAKEAEKLKKETIKLLAETKLPKKIRVESERPRDINGNRPTNASGFTGPKPLEIAFNACVERRQRREREEYGGSASTGGAKPKITSIVVVESKPIAVATTKRSTSSDDDDTAVVNIEIVSEPIDTPVESTPSIVPRQPYSCVIELFKDFSPDRNFHPAMLLGNCLFVDKYYDLAVEAYEDALGENPDDDALLYSNIAEALIRSHRLEEALVNVDKGLERRPVCPWLTVQKVKILTTMDRYEESIPFTQSKYEHPESDNNSSKYYQLLVDCGMDANLVNNESIKGNYEIMQLVREVKRHGKLLDEHADYYLSEKIELREVPNKERGFFATHKIDPGTLLIASKAVVFFDGSKEENKTIVADIEEGKFARLHFELIRKLDENIKPLDDLYKLSAGDGYGVEYDGTKKTGGDQPIKMDYDRLYRIVRRNILISYDMLPPTLDDTVADCGIWVAPALINHSCVDCSCFRFTVGDYMFVYAKKTIMPDEELTFEYVSPWKSYDVRRRLLDTVYDFECTCALCEEDNFDPPIIHHRFRDMEHEATQLYKRADKCGRFESNDEIVLKEYLKQAQMLRSEKRLNYPAIRLQKALAGSMVRTKRKEALELLNEITQDLRGVGDFYGAISNMKLCAELERRASKPNEKELEKLDGAIKRLAKTLFGDERVADVIIAK